MSTLINLYINVYKTYCFKSIVLGPKKLPQPSTSPHDYFSSFFFLCSYLVLAVMIWHVEIYAETYWKPEIPVACIKNLQQNILKNGVKLQRQELFIYFSNPPLRVSEHFISPMFGGVIADVIYVERGSGETLSFHPTLRGLITDVIYV